MQLQIPLEELKNYKSRDLIPLKCKHCDKTFYKSKNEVQKVLKIQSNHRTNDFCDKNCRSAYKSKTHNQNIKCLYCGKIVQKQLCKIKSQHTFCSNKCSAFYNNKNKKYGYKRSKIELYIEYKLRQYNKNLDIVFNDKSIGYELDIYIPSLKLAFEINGIFHYKPIYKQYYRTVEIDKLKSIQCLKHNINLTVFNITHIKKFTPKDGDYYYNLIKEKMEEGTRHALDSHKESVVVSTHT